MIRKSPYALISGLVHGGMLFGLTLLAGLWTVTVPPLEIEVTVGISETDFAVRRPLEIEDVVFVPPLPERRVPVPEDPIDRIFRHPRIEVPDPELKERPAPKLDRPLEPKFDRLPKPPAKEAGAEVRQVAATEVHTPAPRYPSIARRRGYEGVSVVEFEIRKDGTCGRIQVVSSSGYSSLDNAAITAVETWKFRPALRDNIPVSTTKRVRFVFKLTD